MVKSITTGNLVLDGAAELGSYRERLIKSQYEWKLRYVDTGKRLPTVEEYIIILGQSHERNDPGLLGIIYDLIESALCTGTTIDYRKSNIPLGSGYLDQLLSDSAWRKGLEDEVFQYDARKAITILQQVSGKRPYIWTPDAAGRKLHPERAVWLKFNADRFNLYCGLNPIEYYGRSRGVREVSALGAGKPVQQITCQATNSPPEDPNRYLPTQQQIDYARRILDGHPIGRVTE